MFYKGVSMHPTLSSSDFLQIKPYENEVIRCGDVVVFLRAGTTEKIVHRVVSVNRDGIRTRGDNSKGDDSSILKPSDVIGRVMYAQRGNGRRRIYGGLLGQGHVISITARRIACSLISSIIGPYYRWLADTGVLKGFLKTRLLVFARPAGTELQLLLGGRLIGRRTPHDSKFCIRRPYRLFVDESFPKTSTP